MAKETATPAPAETKAEKKPEKKGPCRVRLHSKRACRQRKKRIRHNAGMCCSRSEN